jgi:hypothetical protein
MKIWLPDSMYRVKPLFLMLLGAILLYLSNNFFLFIIAVWCIGYAGWIIVMRTVWMGTTVVSSNLASAQSGQYKALIIDASDG